jgi:hypothetical protein
MSKVYCSECKYLEAISDRGNNILAFRCNAPENMVESDTWKDKKLLPENLPHHLNEKNKCSYYVPLNE